MVLVVPPPPAQVLHEEMWQQEVFEELEPLEMETLKESDEFE